MKPYSDIDALILKYIREQWLSDDEGAELRQWLAESVDRKELIERLTTDPDWVESEIIRMKEVRTEAIWSKVESRLKPLAPIPHTPQTGRRRWFYTAAASFILILGDGTPPHRDFVGRIQRNLPLSEILKAPEEDDVHFKLDGRRLLVTP